MTVTLDPKVLAATAAAVTVKELDAILAKLPINHRYVFDKKAPTAGWLDGQLHYVPVGGDTGNAGRIKLGIDPDNRIAERVVNMLEAHIELARRLELAADPTAAPPSDPRAAVQRYFKLPRLDQLLEIEDDKQTWKRARAMATKTRVRVLGARAERAVIFEDDGVGQSPARLHETILSLGGDNKIKEPYLIGMWGQGGSSALAASQATWMMSRRAPQLKDANDGIAWTVVREFDPHDSRRPYYAYLAASPTGEVPSFAAEAGKDLGLAHGTRIGHLGFDLGTLDPIKLYQALNHILATPVLPFEIFTKTGDKADKPDVCWGVGYLLTRQRVVEKKLDLDKRVDNVALAKKDEK